MFPIVFILPALVSISIPNSLLFSVTARNTLSSVSSPSEGKDSSSKSSNNIAVESMSSSLVSGILLRLLKFIPAVAQAKKIPS